MQMMTFPYLQKRVSIAQSHGCLRIQVAHINRRGLGIFGLLFSTLFLLLAGPVFIGPLWRAGWSIEALYLLPLPVLVAIAYLIAIHTCLWEAFGREEIVVQDGLLRWTCKALWWKDELEVPVGEISDVRAVTPWHGGNRVELTARGRSYRVGEKILRDEATHMAHALRGAAGLG